MHVRLYVYNAMIKYKRSILRDEKRWLYFSLARLELSIAKFFSKIGENLVQADTTHLHALFLKNL